jgi:hypothetical protein
MCDENYVANKKKEIIRLSQGFARGPWENIHKREAHFAPDLL